MLYLEMDVAYECAHNDDTHKKQGRKNVKINVPYRVKSNKKMLLQKPPEIITLQT